MPDDEESFVAMTPEQAQAWRKSHPAVSPWRTVLWQAVVGVLISGLAWLLTGQARIAWSTGYGALCVLLPAMVFVRGMRRQQGAGSAGAALVGLMVWELAKLGLTLAMLLLAPRLLGSLSWPALLVGFVVTMKVYWLALWRASRPASARVY